MFKRIQLMSIVFTAIALSFSSCKKDDDTMTNGSSTSTETPDISERGANPDEGVFNEEGQRNNRGGYLYTESNAAGQNSILCYKQHADGSLTLEATVASGGSGAGSSLGSQGAIAIDHNHHWLFAVNAGDNSISSFSVANDGSLTLSQTVGSWGIKPVSLTCHNDLLYVVNSGSDNISGFRIGSAGQLTVLGSSQRSLSGTATDPAQISFSDDGSHLYVSEKMSNKITTFAIDAIGVASVSTSVNSTGTTPFGFDFARGFMIVSNASGGNPNASSATSYNVTNGIHAVNGAVANQQSASCWVASTKYGRFAYVANTGSDNISSYYVAPWGALYLVHQSAVSTGSKPADLVVAANNYHVYNINSMSHSISGSRRAFLGDLVNIGTTTGLPEFASGLVAW